MTNEEIFGESLRAVPNSLLKAQQSSRFTDDFFVMLQHYNHDNAQQKSGNRSIPALRRNSIGSTSDVLSALQKKSSSSRTPQSPQVAYSPFSPIASKLSDNNNNIIVKKTKNMNQKLYLQRLHHY